jgi:hypothetical protein
MVDGSRAFASGARKDRSIDATRNSGELGELLVVMVERVSAESESDQVCAWMSQSGLNE